METDLHARVSQSAIFIAFDASWFSSLLLIFHNSPSVSFFLFFFPVSHFPFEFSVDSKNRRKYARTRVEQVTLDVRSRMWHVPRAKVMSSGANEFRLCHAFRSVGVYGLVARAYARMFVQIRTVILDSDSCRVFARVRLHFVVSSRNRCLVNGSKVERAKMNR